MLLFYNIYRKYQEGSVISYEKDKITSISTGLTFSQFEKLENDFMKQAKKLVEFIKDYWKNAAVK